MCDDFTLAGEETALMRKGISRRDFAAIGAAGILAACAASESEARRSGRAIRETAVAIKMPDGECDAFFVHPTKGRHPAVIMWPDIAGLRDAYKQMARRLAADGFAVLVPNHYYRTLKAPIFSTIMEWRTPEGQAKLRPAFAPLSRAGTIRDAKALVTWLDAQKAVDAKRGVATSGYCMTGPYAVVTATAVPERVRVACSFHGGGLVTDKEDSPHRLLGQSRAGFLIAIARNDDAKAPAEKDELRKAAAAAERYAEVEVYQADHGWCTLDAPAYDKAEADRAWARMLALFKKL